MLVSGEEASCVIGRKDDFRSSATEFVGFRNDSIGDGDGLAALADTALASRFCTWKGRSGRRYVFSVYPARGCPAFRDALLLTVARDRDGRRRAISIRDTGPFPELAVARVERDAGEVGGGVEFHLHLLARSPAERIAALADLGGRAALRADR